MRGITLTQPWASLMAEGHKRVETRSWSTNYRGLVAIHAAKGFPQWAREFASLERGAGRIPGRLPLGAVVAVGQLVDVLPTEDVARRINALERHLGDYSPDRFAWVFRNVVALPEPIPLTGALSLWPVPKETIEAIGVALCWRLVEDAYGGGAV